ncbi:MAG: hypothetical protein KME29_31605 [Calothrix sp. FI2-JRJ7]|nr:hypothetical protein [Calothrix sp. FI2-JRJ7]
MPVRGSGRRPEDEVQIPATIASIFCGLLKQRLMPNWVVALAPIDKLSKITLQSSMSIKGMGTLIGNRILLLLA